ncbi:hypothetical protein EXN66_Car018948 [Channa argus]|uniref:Uncharacterized protein n=1 Tax=Channa argus TaxID=215402 RepID=A0A6G1QKN3_CHAAH|nr:hypothetical protein EXN66_Car018948 [Channa argus]
MGFQESANDYSTQSPYFVVLLHEKKNGGEVVLFTFVYVSFCQVVSAPLSEKVPIKKGLEAVITA